MPELRAVVLGPVRRAAGNHPPRRAPRRALAKDRHPATTLHRFAAETFELERLGQGTDAGEPFWIYSAERCVVDAMRLQHVVGRDVAHSALARYTRRRGADPLRLTALARHLGGERRVREALETILA